MFARAIYKSLMRAKFQRDRNRPHPCSLCGNEMVVRHKRNNIGELWPVYRCLKCDPEKKFK